MYIICALLAKKREIEQPLPSIARATLLTDRLIQCNSANHALLTRKHKQLAECAVTDLAAAAFILKAWGGGKNNAWPWAESRVRDKQRCKVDFSMAVKRWATRSLRNILMLPSWNSERGETRPLEEEKQMIYPDFIEVIKKGRTKRSNSPVISA